MQDCGLKAGGCNTSRVTPLLTSGTTAKQLSRHVGLRGPTRRTSSGDEMDDLIKVQEARDPKPEKMGEPLARQDVGPLECYTEGALWVNYKPRQASDIRKGNGNEGPVDNESDCHANASHCCKASRCAEGSESHPSI